MSRPTDVAPNGTAPDATNGFDEPEDPKVRRLLGLDAEPFASPPAGGLFGRTPAAPTDRDSGDWARVTGRPTPGPTPTPPAPRADVNGGSGLPPIPSAPPVPPRAPQHPVTTAERAYTPASTSNRLPVHIEPTAEPDHLHQIKENVKDDLLGRLGHRLYDRRTTDDELERTVVTEIGALLDLHGSRLDPDERLCLGREIADEVLRHGPLEPFLEDESVSEIMVNGLRPIWVERDGRLTKTEARFTSDAQLRQVIDRIVSRVGRRLDESSPMVDARLPDGSRVNAVVPPLAVDGASMTIRKFTAKAFTPADLVRKRTASPEVLGMLAACVRGKLNVLVTGGTGTGKTTMLNLLSGFIPDDERIVTIEDSCELMLRHENLVRLESRPPNIEGKGEVSIRGLLRNALRMRPDRIVVGEVRGGEALDMLQAMNTGHDGSLSTLHANSPRDALSRVETMVLMAGFDLPSRAIREQTASAVDLIVHLVRLRDGTRRISHIVEVEGMEGDVITLSDLFVLDETQHVGEDGFIEAELRPTGLRPRFADRLIAMGLLPQSQHAGSGGNERRRRR